mmetsp:Transcript_103134/g.183255  ORF Transcript_103134/g.183255 Transcript_103134/m.183255 type:complete len:200 (-) Transcript_103134:149-748(-)
MSAFLQHCRFFIGLSLLAVQVHVAALDLPGAQIAEMDSVPRSPEGMALAQLKNLAVSNGTMELPETLEDVEARWLGVALKQVATFLSESPLSHAKKASTWMLSADQHESLRSRHQSVALSMLSLLGVHLEEHKEPPNSEHKVPAPAQHTMFGGIPWLLSIPVFFGVGLASTIQAVSLHSDWQEQKEKLARGEPIEDLGY